MDATTIYNLLSTLLCLAPFCLGTLVIGGVGFLLIRTTRRQRTPLTAQQVDAQADDLEAQAGQMTAQLRLWTAGALADLSTDWGAKWSRWGRDLNAHGTIPGLSHSNKAAYVAFALRIRGAFESEGIMHARTSQHAFDYRLSRAGVEIRVDGLPLGKVQADGQLLDAEGCVVGEAKRPGGLPVLFQIGGAALLRDKREGSYPLFLGGKIVGHLANPPIKMFNVIELKKTVYPPAAVLAEGISEQESLWLTALAILQAAGYNLLESVWMN